MPIEFVVGKKRDVTARGNRDVPRRNHVLYWVCCWNLAGHSSS